MVKKKRKKGPVWEHFSIISNNDDPHPHVKCNYCSKEFKRAIPEWMQDHLDKKNCQVSNNANFQSIQQDTTSIIDNVWVKRRKNLLNFY